MTEFKKAHDAEAARNNEESVQRGGVTKAVNERQAGLLEVPKPNKYPREGSLSADTDDPSETNNEENTEPNWADPDIEAQFHSRHRP